METDEWVKLQNDVNDRQALPYQPDLMLTIFAYSSLTTTPNTSHKSDTFLAEQSGARSQSSSCVASYRRVLQPLEAQGAHVRPPPGLELPKAVAYGNAPTGSVQGRADGGQGAKAKAGPVDPAPPGCSSEQPAQLHCSPRSEVRGQNARMEYWHCAHCGQRTRSHRLLAGSVMWWHHELRTCSRTTWDNEDADTQLLPPAPPTPKARERSGH